MPIDSYRRNAGSEPELIEPMFSKVLLPMKKMCLAPIACIASFLCGTTYAAQPTVAVSCVSRSDGAREVSFDAELRPYMEIELHAKVTGYLDSMKVDIGDVVREGQLLATLDVPELKIELEHSLAEARRSRAEVERVRATSDEAHVDFVRLTATDKAQPHLIAAQTLDSAKAHDRSAAATLEAANEQANVAESEVKKLRAMLDYSQITAPFAGVVTKRHADPGALIQAGTSTGALPVVRLSENDRLRAVFPVSISFVSNIRVGDPVELHITSLNRTISGTIARFARKVETSTRTMEAEVDVPNADLSLLPGIYAVAVLKTEQKKNCLFVPIEAVLREKTGASVYVVNKQHLVEVRTVTVGLETPTKIEILSGAEEDEMVLLGSRAQVTPGDSVQPKLIQTSKVN